MHDKFTIWKWFLPKDYISTKLILGKNMIFYRVQRVYFEENAQAEWG